MSRNAYIIVVKSLLFIMALSGSSQLLASSGSIVFAIAVGEDKPIYKALDQISREAFEQMDVDYRSVPCIPTRCGQMVTQDKVDGEPVRPAGYSHFYPQLLRVDASIVSMSIVAMVKDVGIELNALSDLEGQQLNVGFQHGYRNFDLLVPRYVPEPNIVRLVHWREGLQKLDSGAIDVYLAFKQIAISEIPADRRASYTVTDMQDAEVLRTYPFLNKKYAHMKEPLAREINKMRQSGRIHEIFEAYGIPVTLISR